MILHPANIDDADRISKLINCLCKPFLISPDGEDAALFFAAISKEAIEGYIGTDNYSYTIAEDGNTLAGVIAIRDNRHLFHLFVAPDYQQMGIARMLWSAAKDKAMRDGNPGVFTVNSSLNALPVYRKFGFSATAGAVQKHGVVFVPMEYHLRRLFI